MNEITREDWPEQIESEDQLDKLLTRPSAALAQFIKTVSSPLLILGAGGKMGPTLAVLAKRAADAANYPLDVIAVSRFTDNGAQTWLEGRGVKTLSRDLLLANSLDDLPETENVIYLVGLKFGTAKNPATTWAMNTVVPARVAEKYPLARIVALSTANVYPLSEVSRGGSQESDPLTPLGEYANAAIGRERIFEFYSRRDQVAVALLRLHYAVELRYGVLVDIARKIQAEESIPLANGFFSCIWQGNANEMILRALSLPASPPTSWNLCRPEVFSVRAVASRLGELLGIAPQFEGAEEPTALLSNSDRLCAKLGPPSVSLEMMLRWIAHWVKQGGRDLGRPTHFEQRDGNY